MKLPNNFRAILFPSLLFFLSFFLRLSLISKGPYHLDCLALAINAQNTLDTHQLQHQFGSGYPLTVLTGSFFIAILRLFSINDPVFAVNLMSVIFSSLSVLMFYALLKDLTSPRAAFWGAICFSLHPIFLTLSVYGNSHVICIFFLLTSLYFLSHPDLKFRWGAFSIFFGLMGAARLQDMILMIVPVGLFLITAQRNNTPSLRQRIIAISSAIFFSLLIAGVFHLPYLLGNSGSQYTSQFQTFWNIGLAKNFQGLLSARLYRSLTIICFATTLPAILVIWFGLWRMFQKKLPLAVLILSWFLVPLTFYGNLLTSVPRFYLISVVALCMAFGYGIDQFLDYKKKFVTCCVAVTCLIVTLLPNVTHIFPVLYFRHTHALLPEWAQFIKKQTEPQAIIITGDDEFFIKYYGNREFLSRPKNEKHLNESEFNSFKQQLSREISLGTPVYITTCGLSCYDPNQEFSSYIRENYRLYYRGHRDTEDWHVGELFLDRVFQSLYKLEPLVSAGAR